MSGCDYHLQFDGECSACRRESRRRVREFDQQTSIWPFIWLVVLCGFVVWCVVGSVPVFAQEVMLQPFVPQGFSEVGGNPNFEGDCSVDQLEAETVFEGLDENGDAVYSKEYAGIDCDEWGDMSEVAMEAPNSASIYNLYGYSVSLSYRDAMRAYGYGFDESTNTHYFVMIGNLGGYSASQPTGACEIYEASGPLPVGTEVGMSINQCLTPFETLYDVTFDDSYDVGCLEGVDVVDGSSVVVAHFTPDGAYCLEEGDFGEMFDARAVEAAVNELMTSGDSDLIGQTAIKAAQDESVYPYSWNLLANNHTDDYEAAGDIGDVPGGSRTPYALLGGTPGGGDGDGDGMTFDGQIYLDNYCAANPDKFICSDVGEEEPVEGVGDFTVAIGEAETLLYEAEDIAEGAIDDLTAFELGSGPEVGPAPLECPIEDMLQIEAMNGAELDLTVMCEIIGGPLKKVIEISSYIVAAFIVWRGLTI